MFKYLIYLLIMTVLALIFFGAALGLIGVAQSEASPLGAHTLPQHPPAFVRGLEFEMRFNASGDNETFCGMIAPEALWRPGDRARHLDAAIRQHLVLTINRERIRDDQIIIGGADVSHAAFDQTSGDFIGSWGSAVHFCVHFDDLPPGYHIASVTTRDPHGKPYRFAWVFHAE